MTSNPTERCSGMTSQNKYLIGDRSTCGLTSKTGTTVREARFQYFPKLLAFNDQGRVWCTPMDMIDEELTRLSNRLSDLILRVIPQFENKTQLLYSQIMPMEKESEVRQTLEAEYSLLSKELRLRSDELIKIRQEMDSLEQEKKSRR